MLNAADPPVEVCLADTTDAGGNRLVLVVTQFEPPKQGSAALHVIIPGERERVIGLFPGKAFDTRDVSQHRRMLLYAQGKKPSLDEARCVLVSLETKDNTGSATVHLELTSHD